METQTPTMRYDPVEAVKFADQMADKKLILTVGLPYSGKSTWAKAHSADALRSVPIVNRDAICLALTGRRCDASQNPRIFDIEETMIRSLFLAGHNIVIVDACNVKEKERLRFRTGEWEVLLKEFKTEPDTCIQRAEAAGDLLAVPVIDRLWKEWELPGPNERGL